MKKPLSFVIIGSGWRSLFFVRNAQRYPQEFDLKYMLSRTEERAEEVRRQYNVKATTSEAEVDAAKPDFIIVSVPRPVMVETCLKWARKGYPILAETPLGTTPEELKMIWEVARKENLKLQVAEQYHRYPFIAAGLHAIEQGKLGDPYSCVLSVAHDYHAASMIRRMLQIRPQNMKLMGKGYKNPVEETDCRAGAIKDGRVALKERRLVTIEFECGKTAWYDWDGVQYHTFIRSRHLNVQGQKGEWNDTLLHYVDENHEPHTEMVCPWLNPKYQDLCTMDLIQQAKSWNPMIDMNNIQDELAVGSMMYDMREYIEGGEEVYPLAEALADAYTWLLIEEAAKNPGKEIISEDMPFFTH